MGKFISSYVCECNEDCKQGLSGKNKWSKPDNQPQPNLPLIAQESAVKVESRSPSPNGAEPLLALPEKGGSSFGSSVSQPIDDVAHVPTDSTAVPSDLSPSEKAGVNGVFIFEVAVAKEAGEGYGFAHASVEDSSNTLMIVALRDQGPIARYNDTLQKGDEKTVRLGDRIVAVGGVVDDADAMRSKLRQDSADLTLERWPQTIVIALSKRSPADTYGLSTQPFQREDGSLVLQVVHVEDGLMSEWNSAACQSRRFHEIVRPTYDIVKLDEFVGDPEKMQQALTTRVSVELTLNRPDPPSMLDK